jgi:CHAT domain-containing protein
MLPFHAAGIFKGPIANQDNVSNYAVSSYTPTLAAFCRAVNQSSKVTTSTGQSKSALVIADQVKSCAYARLPHIAAEAEIIKGLIAPACMVDFDGDTPRACVSFATRTTPSVELLHIACHGKQESDDPLQSGLELRGGRLTLEQLTRVTFPNGRLAYLSACETASCDPACPDNGMNLAATFLFNGFKSVIGSMW